MLEPGRWLATAGRWGLYGVLATWFGVSVMQQLDKQPDFARRIDPTSMAVPNWRFFAPTPARHDINVLYRDKLPDGRVKPWREEVIAIDRNLVQMVWHPRRRMEKAVFDAASELFRISEHMKQVEQIQLTVPYLALLNFVTNQVPHDPDATHVQFLLASSAGHDDGVEPRMLFLSEFHALN